MLVIVLLAMAAAAGGYVYLRRSLPQVNGTVAVAGLSAPIDIIRDADAIPHIFAATKADALFGLGYVHAQDRLWQMELQRRIGFGRLSQVFGAATLPRGTSRCCGRPPATRCSASPTSEARPSRMPPVSPCRRSD